MGREEIFGAIEGNMKSVIEGARNRPITETQSLVEDFGADSLEIVEVVSRTMKQLRIKIPRTQLSSAKNIGQLVDLFVQNATAA